MWFTEDMFAQWYGFTDKLTHKFLIGIETSINSQIRRVQRGTCRWSEVTQYTVYVPTLQMNAIVMQALYNN